MTNLEFLEEFVNRTSDGAYIVNQNQRIIAWNAAAERLLGFQAREVIGVSCYQILGGRSEGDCQVCKQGCLPFTELRRGQLVPTFNARVRSAGGRPRWVNMTIIGVSVATEHADLPLVVIHLFRDVETQHQAEVFARDVATWARQMEQRTVENRDGEPRGTPTVVLSQRELQVLSLLCQGASTDAIASALVIGKPTARNHIQRILHKLGVHSRLEAVNYARDHHLLGD